MIRLGPFSITMLQCLFGAEGGGNPLAILSPDVVARLDSIIHTGAFAQNDARAFLGALIFTPSVGFTGFLSRLTGLLPPLPLTAGFSR